MTVAHAITVLFWLTAATLAVGLARRARLWQAGQAADVDWSGLLAVPKRYFVDLHHVVARDPYIAHTHIATAGGAIAALGPGRAQLRSRALFTGARLGHPSRSGRHADRHRVRLAAPAQRRPPRLSRGAWDRLPYTLAAFAIGLSDSWWLCRPHCFGRHRHRRAPAPARGIRRACARHRPRRSDEARRRRASASRVSSPAGAIQECPLDRAEAARARPQRLWRGEAGRFPLEPALGLRRLRPVRQVRGGVSGLRREPAAQSQEADTRLGRRTFRHERRVLCGQPLSRDYSWRALWIAVRGDRPRSHRAGDTLVVHHLPRLRRGMPDADRACRRHRRHAQEPQPQGGRRAREGGGNACQPARDGHAGRLLEYAIATTGPSISMSPPPSPASLSTCC